jgi:hypothetical protein
MIAATQRIHPEVTRNANRPTIAKKKSKLTKAKQRTIGQLFAAIGASFLPVASYAIAHVEVESNPTMWILVAAALTFSAPMLIQWSQRWCGHVVKALGFTVLLEGVMVFSSLPALRLTGLAILVAINAHAAWSMAQKYKSVKA